MIYIKAIAGAGTIEDHLKDAHRLCANVGVSVQLELDTTTVMIDPSQELEELLDTIPEINRRRLW